MMHRSVLEEESATLSSLLCFLDVIVIQDTLHFTLKQEGKYCIIYITVDEQISPVMYILLQDHGNKFFIKV